MGSADSLSRRHVLGIVQVAASHSFDLRRRGQTEGRLEDGRVLNERDGRCPVQKSQLRGPSLEQTRFRRPQKGRAFGACPLNVARFRRLRRSRRAALFCRCMAAADHLADRLSDIAQRASSKGATQNEETGRLYFGHSPPKPLQPIFACIPGSRISQNEEKKTRLTSEMARRRASSWPGLAPEGARVVIFSGSAALQGQSCKARRLQTLCSAVRPLSEPFRRGPICRGLTSKHDFCIVAFELVHSPISCLEGGLPQA